MPPKKPNFLKNNRIFKSEKIFKNQKGQILVEYLLLMVIAVACATILVRELIYRGPNATKTGIIINQWDKIIKIIGNDIPDCADQTNFSDSGARCP